jgi:hypothetical protein
MPDKKISELPVASALTGYESIPVVQTGNTVRTTLDTVSEYVSGNVRPYKVYTALLTQSGESGQASINTGNLTIGVSYYIDDNSGGADFTNVGAPSNNADTWFIATGTTPTTWGTDGSNLTYDTGAPVVTVLENTIGNIWWTCANDGDYRANSNALFILNKTYTSVSRNGSLGDNITFSSGVIDISSIYLYSGIGGDTLYPDFLNNTPIEIRVYS